VLITDPRDVSDPLSDVIIALCDEVKRLKARVERLDGELQQAMPEEPQSALAVEEEERATYRSQLYSRSDYVNMGEGI